MGYISLHPADCEKYGVDERVEFDLSAIGLKQRNAFEKTVNKPLSWLFEQLQGVPELDEHGNAIPELVVDDDGNPVLDEATGEQKVEPKLTTSPEAIAMFVWLVLWGHGKRIPWDEFDPREIGLRISFASDGEEGKDDAPEPPPDSESSTTTP